MLNKIPKIIHYCWFGKKDKPDIVNNCIDSWKRILTDYKIIEWNEENFDVESNLYVKQAYESGKFAFVSDYVRLKALYDYGGIYLDTDVEVFKSFDDLLDNESIWGFEEANYIATSTIGAKKGNEIIGEFLNLYNNKSFISNSGDFEFTTNVTMVTDLLEKRNVDMDNSYQKLNYATIYPREFFSPYDYANCRDFTTENTYCKHYFYKSWIPFHQKIKSKVKFILSKIIGGDNIAKIREYIK